MRTTLNSIRRHSPCRDGWEKLLRHLDKTQPDDEPLLIKTILGSNGLIDALWCLRAVEGHAQEMRLYAVWCARRIQHLMSDPRSVAALDVAEQHARGRATDEELRMAAMGANAVGWAAAAECAFAVALVAECAAAVAVVAEYAAAVAGTRAGERTAQATELRRICREIEAGRDPYPEEGGR